MSVLRIRDENGNFVDIPAIKGGKGEPGKDGKSAYQHALDGGYTGTEQEFNAMIGSLSPDDLQTYMEHLFFKDNPHKVTAAQVGSLKIYNSFAAMNTDLGTTFGVTTPIVTIIQALPNNTGLVADINTYGQESEYPCVYGVLSIYKIRENRVTVEYVSNAEVGSAAHNKRWIGQYNAGVFGGFKQILTEAHLPTAKQVGAMPTSGGEFSGNIHVFTKEGSFPAMSVGQDYDNRAALLYTAEKRAYLQNRTDGDAITFSVGNTAADGLDNLLGLWVGGARYNVYGKHNLPNPAQVVKGTYNGTYNYNDSSTNVDKSIYIGGTGNVLLIYYQGGIAIATPVGILMFNVDGNQILTSSIYQIFGGNKGGKFENGYLYLKARTDALSRLCTSGITYYYQTV